MKSRCRSIFLLCFSSLVVLLLSTSFSALAADEPIHIEANAMTSVEKSNTVIFTGDVDAKQGDVRIRSDKMTVYYTPKEEGKDKKGDESASQQVEKLVCVGNVEITRAEWLGTSKKMIYLEKARKVILTNNAKLWQNQNMVSGEKITYYLDEGRSEVEGPTSTTVGGTGGGKPGRVNMTIKQD